MKDNINNIGDYLGQCMDMFFWDYVSYKNTPSMRATKIFKNNEEYILRQFSSIHGYIWCNACYRYALADNCPKHSRSNMIWQLILSTYLMSCYSMTSHQIDFNVLRTILDVLRTFLRTSLPSVERMMFFRTDYRFLPALLRTAHTSAFGICVKTLPLAGNGR